MSIATRLIRAGRRSMAALVIASLSLQSATAQRTIDPEAAARTAQTMARALQATEDGLLAMERDRWDPQGLADSLGADPEALHGFMRRNVIWAPYAGALRGARGVLMDRTANALDGALAMAALLKASGYEARLARAALTPEAVAALRSAPAEEPPEEEAAISPDPLASAAEAYGLDPAQVKAGLAAGASQEETLESEIRLARQVAALASALGPPQTPAPEPDPAAALADHWWAQYLGPEGWTDADWLTAEGAAPAPADETMAVEALPPGLYHRVKIAVSVEQADKGEASATRIIEAEIIPALGEGDDLSLTHLPMNWPSDWSAGGPDEVQFRLRAAFASQTEWQPILTIGEESFGPWSVRADGSLNPDPAPSQNPFLPVGVTIAGQALAAADALRQGMEEPEALASGAAPEPTGQFTAEWLDFEILSPGADPRRERRYVFDLIGPAARAAGTAGAFAVSDEARALRALGAMSETKIRVFAAQPAPEWLLHQSAEALLASRPALTQLSADPFGRVPSNLSEMVSGLRPGPGPIEAFAASRTAFNAFGGAVYQDRPLVVALHSGYERDGATGDFLAVQALDLVEAGMGVLPGAAADPFLIRLFQGVADAEAESAALGGGALGNAGAAFDPADPSWRLIASAADLPTDAPSAMAAQIAAALAEGYVAFAPLGDPEGAAAQAGAWWRIRPATGETLAMGPKGWGQAMVEWAFLLVLKTLWAQIACMARVAAIRAASEAFDKGRVTLPKTAAELKAGTTDVAKACVREALLNQLTGMTAMIFVGLPGYGASRLNNWAAGADGWTAAPSTLGRLPGRGPGMVDPLAATRAAADPLAATHPASGGGARSPAATTLPPGGPAASGEAPLVGRREGVTTPGPRGVGSGTESPAFKAADDRYRQSMEDAIRANARHDADPTPQNAAAAEAARQAHAAAIGERMGVWSADAMQGNRYPMPDYYPLAQAGGSGSSGGVGRVDPLGETQAPPGGSAALEKTMPAGGGFASTLAGMGAIGSAFGDP